jgi:hypothetical protein
MRRRLAMLVGVLLLGAACGGDPTVDPTGPTDGDAVTPRGPWQTPTGVQTLEEAETHADALARDTLDHLGVSASAAREDPDDPIVIACDEGDIDEDTAFTVKVSYEVADVEDPDDLLSRAEAHWQEQGVEGLELRFADSAPQLAGVFEDERWQVSLTVNRDHGLAWVTVNTPCLPSQDRDTR